MTFPRSQHAGLLRCVAALAASLVLGTSWPAHARLVTDMSGATVEIKNSAAPIADLWFAHNEISVMLGAAPRIRITAENPADNPWLFKIAPILYTAHIGIKPDTASAEYLLANRIGLVFVPTASKAEELRRSGINALAAEYMTMPDMLTSLDMSAEAIGTTEAHNTAKRYRQEMERVLELLKFRTAQLHPSERPRVLHIARLSPLQIDGSKTLIDAWIQAAGGTNAATVAGNHRPVSFEQIAVWNPDVVIVDASAGDLPESSPLRTLNAFKQQKWWTNPKGVFAWDRYGCEELLQLQWAAKKLHPALFADLDMQIAVRNFYNIFFRHHLSDDDIARILAAQPPAP
ncbi:TroA family protein [Acetobacter syzygii]|uniref:Sugar ABC transporter substrate-binding protein n=1 Tax=Acetobacter syzygii TaxID=146476 RepID=A0A270BVW6_9PROT|nr:ABC transporter substrate-binding protein [Acetobacter syzygii]NSL91637.1 ABC transporter substrate-binding protein [Acetobacter syzygii]PAL24373.1 sugar ABC transporter substrate-binding protein [Acetobacter syzygii]PAL29153.1 sugar ABC transporter substrate-binding protein [Acetobacter syzygii]GAN71800.1 ABC transporter ferrichrome transport [Acetobacter syzygii]GBR64757.1 Fe3+ transporter ferrichrome-binding periplasmic protein [Acetobacter syzygii NRIC 0483]